MATSPMARRRLAGSGQAGFTVAELLVVCVIIGILATAAIPAFLSYYQTAALRTTTDTLAAFINQGRQIAIKENQPVCVHTTSGAIHFHISGCGGTTWTGPSTDSSGNLKLPSGFTLSTSADPIFNYLGAASPTATYTVTQTTTGKVLRVTVAVSGRVTVGP